MNWKTIPGALFVLATLTACAAPAETAKKVESSESAQPANSPPAAENMNGVGICNSRPAQAAIGHLISSGLLQQVAQVSGARIVRALRPNQAVTKEYSSERINVHVDDKDIVRSVDCG